MSQHTPKPWRIEEDRFHNFQIYSKNRDILDDLPVADNVMKKEDAALIASAPELLAALKKAYVELLNQGVDEQHADMVEIAAILSKVGGRQ